jgi:hypothetical protein
MLPGSFFLFLNIDVSGGQDLGLYLLSISP